MKDIEYYQNGGKLPYLFKKQKYFDLQSDLISLKIRKYTLSIEIQSLENLIKDKKPETKECLVLQKKYYESLTEMVSLNIKKLELKEEILKHK